MKSILQLNIVAEGSNRSILVLNSKVNALGKWLNSLSSDQSSKLRANMQKALELEHSQLLKIPAIWRREKGTTPAIYVLVANQCRLYCCMRSEDIIVLDWALKKKQRADSKVLERAQRLAHDFLNSQGPCEGKE